MVVMLILRIHWDVSDLGTTTAFQASGLRSQGSTHVRRPHFWRVFPTHSRSIHTLSEDFTFSLSFGPIPGEGVDLEAACERHGIKEYYACSHVHMTPETRVRQQSHDPRLR